VFANAPTELSNLYVFRVNCVGVQRGSIGKNCDQACVVRAWQVQHVKPYSETLNLGYEFPKPIQQFHMFVPFELGYISAVLPNNNMCQHLFGLVQGQKLKRARKTISLFPPEPALVQN